MLCNLIGPNGYPCPNRGAYVVGGVLVCGDHRDAAQSAVSEAELALAAEAGERE